MIAMNYMEVLIFIGIPAAFVILIISAIWVEKSDHPIAREQRRINALPVEYEDDDGRNYQLEDEMKKYYQRKNNER